MLRLFPIGANARNWTTLAETYSGSVAPEIAHYGMSARIGWVNYQSCLFIGVSTSGLSMLNLFPLGDEELLIPWPQIRFLGRGWFGLSVLLYVKGPRMKVRVGCGITGGLKIVRAIEKKLSLQANIATSEPPPATGPE